MRNVWAGIRVRFERVELENMSSEESLIILNMAIMEIVIWYVTQLFKSQAQNCVTLRQNRHLPCFEQRMLSTALHAAIECLCTLSIRCQSVLFLYCQTPVFPPVFGETLILQARVSTGSEPK